MRTHGKKYRTAVGTIEPRKLYAPPAAVEQVKNTAFAKFDESVDVAVRLGDRFAFDQSDLDRRLLEFPGEVGQHLRSADRIRARQHQCRRTGEERLQPAVLQLFLGQRAPGQRVFDHHVLDADRAEAAAQVRDVRHVETREIGDVDRRRPGDLRRQSRDHLLFLRFGAVHT